MGCGVSSGFRVDRGSPIFRYSRPLSGFYVGEFLDSCPVTQSDETGAKGSRAFATATLQPRIIQKMFPDRQGMFRSGFVYDGDWDRGTQRRRSKKRGRSETEIQVH